MSCCFNCNFIILCSRKANFYVVFSSIVQIMYSVGYTGQHAHDLLRRTEAYRRPTPESSAYACTRDSHFGVVHILT